MSTTKIKEIKEKGKAKLRGMDLTLLSELAPIGRIPTGVAPWDLYTDGGFPQGTTTLLTGVEKSGKTTFATLGIVGFQRLFPNRSTLYLNAENKIDPDWLQILGGDPTKVGVAYPETSEEAQYLVTEVAAERKDVGLVIVDSLAALCPVLESQETPYDEQMGIAARLNNKFFRKLTSIQLGLYKQKRSLTVIVINQERESLKLYGGTVIPGGKGQRFHAACWCKFLKPEAKVDQKLGVPIRTNFRFVFVKSIGNASDWPGEVEMCLTPHGSWKPGQFIDQEFVWNWAAPRLHVLTNRGSKGWEYQGRCQPKAEWITLWESNATAYASIKADLLTAFKEWKSGGRQAEFIKDSLLTKTPILLNGESHETMGEV